jgi:uracil-DNA glycosylase
MFTGDRSGDFLYRAMHGAGLCNQPTSTSLDDGLRLERTVVTAAVHCAPPDNKPTPQEFAACAPYLEETFDALPHLRVMLCLGKLAHDAVLRLYKARGWIDKLAPYPFGHGAEYAFDPPAEGDRPIPTLLGSFHPSQQNTFTGRLTPAMLAGIMRRAHELMG